jgi:hypothetical protein
MLRYATWCGLKAIGLKKADPTFDDLDDFIDGSGVPLARNCGTLPEH